MLRPINLLDVFGPSPIKPLRQHMEQAHACAKLLIPFFNATIAEQWSTARQLQQEISNAERAADDLKRRVRTHLPKGLLLPVSRSDLLSLLSEQEKLANTAKDIAGIMLGRKMIMPKKIKNEFLDFLNHCVLAAAQAKQIIDTLSELLESGFRGKEVIHVDQLLDQLNETECETDKKQIKLRQSLFNIEKAPPPIEVMFLYKIIELTGYLADYAQQVGNRLQMLIAD